jgi:hypothetical protein
MVLISAGIDAVITVLLKGGNYYRVLISAGIKQVMATVTKYAHIK